jgi:opacity protein-like surface antigen
MKTMVVCAALVLAIAAPRAAQAQSPLSLEITADGAVPTQTLGGSDLGTGFGFGANLRYRFMPHLAAYAGWEFHHHRSDDLIGGRRTDVEDTGYTVGLRFEHPLAGRTAYWVRAGALYSHIELENADGDLVADSGHGVGWEGGAGLAIPLRSRLALTPGFRYRTLTRDLEIGSSTSSVTLSYLTFGTGVAITF